MAKVPIARIEGAAAEGSVPQEARTDRADAAKKASVSVESNQDAAKKATEEARPAAGADVAPAAAKPVADAVSANGASPKSAAEKPKAAVQPKPKPKARPKTKVAPAVEAEEPAVSHDDPATEPSEAGLEDEPNDAFEQARSIGQALKAWMAKTFPGHAHAVAGGVCGLLVAILFFVFGFWKTLFVCLLVTVGVAVGQYLDGDPRIVDLIRRLVSEGRGGN